ncbi:MAG: peptide chain release factor N(5)-glutamine methyltransferase [candidate division KSB1 bacterium]|nr:peptide chain release factor N(5)-glutamine methyltransferase [candidate division KSB1 bacterium]MDZ7317705.1 peptide chain release factor N(5)-glutamine methyltransferase [candidate division KSB1 bacterium]
MATMYRLVDIIKMSADYLQQKGLDHPRLDAELLIGHVLQLNRVQLYLNYDRPITTEEQQQLRNLLRRRALHEPIQYILGEAEFFSLKFKLNRHCLIPRPETELLVEIAIDCCGQFKDSQRMIQILDIGTGCGNIAIALAKHVDRASITAIDIDPEALAQAEANARMHQVQSNIRFLLSDIFAAETRLQPETFDVVIANPPYISKAELEKLPSEIKNFEPRQALDGGIDGLQFYFRIAEFASKRLAASGSLLVEIGANQAESVHAILSDLKIFQQIKIEHDLNRLPRVMVAHK